MVGVFSLACSPVPDIDLVRALWRSPWGHSWPPSSRVDQAHSSRSRIPLWSAFAFWSQGPGRACWPVGVALIYEVMRRYGWAGPAPSRLAGPASAFLTVLSWWPGAGLAPVRGAANDAFVDVVLTQDYRARLLHWGARRGRRRLLRRRSAQALSILLPWSLLLPVALWSGVRRAVEPARPPGRRLALVVAWTAAVFVARRGSRTDSDGATTCRCAPRRRCWSPLWVASPAMAAAHRWPFAVRVARRRRRAWPRARSTHDRTAGSRRRTGGAIATEAGNGSVGRCSRSTLPRSSSSSIWTRPVLVPPRTTQTFARQIESTDLLIPTRKLPGSPASAPSCARWPTGGSPDKASRWSGRRRDTR